MTRRDALRIGGTAGALLLCRPESLATAFQDPRNRTAGDVDHIMWGARSLDEGIAFIESKTGVKAVFGGVHPNRGTRNALVSLGKEQYLEILSLDPAQPGVRDERTDALARMTTPRILTWAAGTRDIEALDRRVRAAGFQTTGIAPGARAKPDGTTLRWKTLALNGQDSDLIPFVIQWDPGSTHPSADSPGGCTLEELRLEHPDPAAINRVLEAMGLRVRAARGPRARITALLSTPKGEFELI
jgi:hypothetical protein